MKLDISDDDDNSTDTRLHNRLRGKPVLRPFSEEYFMKTGKHFLLSEDEKYGQMVADPGCL